MSASEYYGWSQYLSVEPTNSVEIQSALVAQVANNAMGGKAKLADMLITSHQSNKENTTDDTIANRPSDDAIKKAFGVF